MIEISSKDFLFTAVVKRNIYSIVFSVYDVETLFRVDFVS